MSMTVGDHPDWEPFLAALDALTAAAKRLDHARTADAADLRAAEAEFEQASKRYDAARERIS